MPQDLIISVNIPFCFHICGFCDKAVYSRGRPIRDAYYRALLRELDSVSDELANYRLRSLYFSGGIPTILAEMQLPSLAAEIEKRLELADDFQFTVATAPGCIGINVLSRLKDLKLSRMEFGLCTTHAFELDVLERRFTEGDMYVSRQILEFGKLENFSVDLCYGLPGQNRASLLDSLLAALSFAPPALALYPLRLREGTPLYRRIVEEKGARIAHLHHRALPEGEALFAAFSQAEEKLRAAGMAPYTAFHHAKPGFEGLHHRLVRQDVDRIGLGLGGVSITEGLYMENTGDLEQYIRAAGDPAGTLICARALSEEERMARYARGTLSLGEGLSMEECRARFGRTPEGPAWETLAEEGLIARSAGRIALTQRGRCFAGSVFARI